LATGISVRIFLKVTGKGVGDECVYHSAHLDEPPSATIKTKHYNELRGCGYGVVV